jgi:hypothetical protein
MNISMLLSYSLHSSCSPTFTNPQISEKKITNNELRHS